MTIKKKKKKVQKKKTLKKKAPKKRVVKKKVQRPAKKLAKPRIEQDDKVEKLEQLLSIVSRGKYLWESSFDAIAAPVHIVSGDYRVDRANLSTSAVAGRDVTVLVGDVCYSALAGYSAPCPGCPVALALEKGFATGEVRFKGHAYNVHAYTIQNINPPLVVVTYNDVSEERRLQSEVIQQEKMAAIGMLAGGVAHEINNPLGGILAFTQLLLKGKCNDEDRKDLKEIEGAALRCKNIISDLLDFSRSSKEGEKRLININELLEKVFPFVSRELKSYNVELAFNPKHDLPMVMAHPDRLQQVFLNLMTNACHAMPYGGHLKIQTEMNNAKVLISVADTGEGMDPSVYDRIFEPFFTTKEAGKGTGLGLAISYRIINDHGGKIEVSSKRDEGSKFMIHLPIAEV